MQKNSDYVDKTSILLVIKLRKQQSSRILHKMISEFFNNFLTKPDEMTECSAYFYKSL